MGSPESGRKRRNHERGAAMVEMALIMPLLLLMVLGIFEFGRVYNAKITLTHATREAVRVYSLTGDADEAESTLFAASAPLDTSVMSMSSSDCDRGEPTSITVSYPFTFSFLFGGSTITLESTAVMRCGG
jgi:Flp pilus assembly protein TadG